jgi:hypothetical protein
MRSVALTVLVLLAACAPQPPITINSTYNPEEAAFSKLPGNQTVSGQGFLRQAGGGVVTCAGSEVSLVPNTSYGREMISTIYGNASSGYKPFALIPHIESASKTQYFADRKQVRCDAQGNFAFRNVPNGDYFVTTLVRWMVPVSAYTTNHEGGILMRAVSVRGTDATDVILTN